MALTDKEWDEYDHEAWAELLASRNLVEREDCPYAYMIEHDTGDSENPGLGAYFGSRQAMVAYVLAYDGDLS